MNAYEFFEEGCKPPFSDLTEESNPVILDLSFLEKESPANFKLAGEKIKQMRSNYGAEALLLSRCNDKNLIIIAPKGVSLVRK